MPSLLLLVLAACGGGGNVVAPPAGEPVPPPPPTQAQAVEAPAPPAADVPEAYKALFRPVKEAEVETADRNLVELGRMLYYDTRLSVSQELSCNSCHKLDAYGVDGQPTSPGHRGQRGDRNSPTVYNAAGHVAQFWDGRAADLAEQAKGPVLNPVEMAMPSAEAVVAVLTTIPGYEAAFAAAFPEAAPPAISYDNMARAIATFEKYLVTPSRFDRWLEGDGSALTPEERHGLDVFVGTGCTACHNGANVGGGMFQKLGAVVPYDTKDPGREKVTKQASDRHVFKVPSLRNVARTGPWFHDGTVGTLETAVRLMAKHQLGKDLSPEDTQAIVAFLGSLTGEVDGAYVAEPQLPPSGPKTPGPRK